MLIEFHQVDSFSDKPFGGNPAIVYRLDSWLPDALMQSIAAEHNLAETAFLVHELQGWHIRWFTPTTEVPLCGHATLASAYVLFNVYEEPASRINFISRSGPLSVSREDDRLWLDFPTSVPSLISDNASITQALGVDALAVLGTDKLLVVLESEQAVLDCRPNMAALAKLPWLGAIVTARGVQHDFISRFFAPAIGVDEDPVTGAAHCSLIPYWAERLTKTHMTAYQCSARGGELLCRLEGDRVKIGGHATLVSSGQLRLGSDLLRTA